MSRPSSDAGVNASIVVVGGGLSGLLASCVLAEHRDGVTLVAPEPKADGRSTALLGASVEALRRVGVWSSVAAKAQPLRAIRIVDATSRLARAPEVLFRAEELDLPAFGYNVPNAALLEGLGRAAKRRGVRIVQTVATDVSVTSGAAGIRLADGSSLAAELVVACDGQRSRLREGAGIDVRVGDCRQTALAATFDHTEPHDDISTEFHTENGPFTLVPLPGKKSAVVWVTSSTDAEALAELSPTDFAERATECSRHLLGALTLDGPVQRFPLRSMVADRVTAPRLVLVGEAGHALPPIGAQGFNLTVRDIDALAALVDGSPTDCGATKVTDAYERERRRDIATRKFGVDAINASLLSDFLPVQLARGAGLFAMARSRWVRRVTMRLGLGLSGP